MAENERGFHNPASQGHDHNRGGSVGGPPGGKHKHMAEPTNHAGHTYEMARRHEHDRRVEATRAIHAGAGQQDHERILHDTHRLHQTDGHFSHGNKHGESHHLRDHERTEGPTERAEERAEGID